MGIGLEVGASAPMESINGIIKVAGSRLILIYHIEIHPPRSW